MCREARHHRTRLMRTTKKLSSSQRMRGLIMMQRPRMLMRKRMMRRMNWTEEGCRCLYDCYLFSWPFLCLSRWFETGSVE